MRMTPSSGTRRRSPIIAFAVLAAWIPSVAAPSAGRAPVTIQALEYAVADVSRAVHFYTQALGFRPESGPSDDGAVVLRNGDARLLLRPTKDPAAPPDSVRLYLNMSVGSLDAARRAVMAAGGIVHGDPRESAVGPYLEVLDPHGHPVHLIDHPDDDLTAEDPPVVFNLGVHVREMEEAERFLGSIGFEVATRDYLPTTLVFRRSGWTYLVVHRASDLSGTQGLSTGALVLESTDPRAVAARAGSASGTGPGVSLRDPSGNLYRVVAPGAPERAGGGAR